MFAICYRPSVYLYCLSSVTFVHRTPYSGDWNFRQCLSDPWWYLQTPCVSADFFLSVEDFFCHILLGICVSVQYVQSIWYAMCCWKWMVFFLSVMDFFMYVMVYDRAVVWVIRDDTCRLHVYQRIFSCLLRIFSCHLLLSICASLQSSTFRVVDVLCAVSYAVAEYEWIFFLLIIVDFFLCAIVFIRSVVWVIRGVTCKLLVYMGGFFPVCCGLFPVIHTWAFVHQSSMVRVVDVLCAVSCTVAEDEWIFSLCYGFFPVCRSLHRAVLLVIRGVQIKSIYSSHTTYTIHKTK